MRVFTDAFDQSRSQRIGYDVACNTTQAFIIAQCVIVEPALPNFLLKTKRHFGLIEADYTGQVSTVFELH